MSKTLFPLKTRQFAFCKRAKKFHSNLRHRPAFSAKTAKTGMVKTTQPVKVTGTVKTDKAVKMAEAVKLAETVTLTKTVKTAETQNQKS